MEKERSTSLAFLVPQQYINTLSLLCVQNFYIHLEDYMVVHEIYARVL